MYYHENKHINNLWKIYVSRYNLDLTRMSNAIKIKTSKLKEIMSGKIKIDMHTARRLSRMYRIKINEWLL